MNRFRKLGFIEYNGGLEVHSSLLNVVLHDCQRSFHSVTSVAVARMLTARRGTFLVPSVHLN
jgi:hypothetical protein